MASKALCDLNSASLCSSISLVSTPDSLLWSHWPSFCHLSTSSSEPLPCFLLEILFCLPFRSQLKFPEISLASLAKVSAAPYTTASHTVISFDHHIIPCYHLISLEIIYSLFGCLFLYPLQCKLFERLCYACLIY